jgi:hypothetical protein
MRVSMDRCFRSAPQCSWRTSAGIDRSATSGGDTAANSDASPMLPAKRPVVLGFPVTVVGGLAAPLGDSPTRDGAALAPSGLMGDLDVRVAWPLARRTPKDQQRDSCSYPSDEPREFPVGRTAHPRGITQAWI